MAAYHVNPAEALQIHADLDARHSIGIHWGTFELTDESLDEPPRVLRDEAQKRGIGPDRFVVLKHDETWPLPPR